MLNKEDARVYSIAMLTLIFLLAHTCHAQEAETTPQDTSTSSHSCAAVEPPEVHQTLASVIAEIEGIKHSTREALIRISRLEVLLRSLASADLPPSKDPIFEIPEIEEEAANVPLNTGAVEDDPYGLVLTSYQRPIARITNVLRLIGTIQVQNPFTATTSLKFHDRRHVIFGDSAGIVHVIELPEKRIGDVIVRTGEPITHITAMALKDSLVVYCLFENGAIEQRIATPLSDGTLQFALGSKIPLTLNSNSVVGFYAVRRPRRLVIVSQTGSITRYDVETNLSEEIEVAYRVRSTRVQGSVLALVTDNGPLLVFEPLHGSTTNCLPAASESFEAKLAAFDTQDGSTLHALDSKGGLHEFHIVISKSNILCEYQQMRDGRVMVGAVDFKVHARHFLSLNATHLILYNESNVLQANERYNGAPTSLAQANAAAHNFGDTLQLVVSHPYLCVAHISGDKAMLFDIKLDMRLKLGLIESILTNPLVSLMISVVCTVQLYRMCRKRQGEISQRQTARVQQQPHHGHSHAEQGRFMGQ